MTHAAPTECARLLALLHALPPDTLLWHAVAVHRGTLLRALMSPAFWGGEPDSIMDPLDHVAQQAPSSVHGTFDSVQEDGVTQ